MSTEIAKKDPITTASKDLNTSVASVLTADGLFGFEKAHLISTAIVELKKNLTPEYMKNIMAMQGNKLGFRTDKDDKGGYPEDVVKNCLIEAVLTGVQPHSNQFNIIAGNMYITKEGAGHLLKNIKGLKYDIVPGLPHVNSDKSSAAITMKISWTYNGESQEKEIPIPVKMNAYMGLDAVIGKATRKARVWLFNTINGTEIMDGDAGETRDISHTVVDNEDKKEQAKANVGNLFGDKNPAGEAK